MKKLEVASFGIKQAVAVLIGAILFAAGPLGAATIPIVNPGFEDPEMADGSNTSFDGVYGVNTGVPGWSSNEPDFGGAIRVDHWYPGRTGNNVMYIHGSGNQNFYTAGFDLGVDLQSNTTYTLTFDVIRWAGVTMDDYVEFRAGVYTGASYEERSPLAEIAGPFYLLDDQSNPVDAKTVTLTFTTGDIPADTKFWIGGDADGNADDGYRAHFDNFALEADPVPEPSVLALSVGGLAALGGILRKKRDGIRFNA